MSHQLSWDYDPRMRQYIRVDGVTCAKEDWNPQKGQPYAYVPVKASTSLATKQHTTCQSCGAPKINPLLSCDYCRT